MMSLMEIAGARRPRTNERPTELPRCASPDCANLVHEPWEETGTFCGRCAIGMELFDRDTRRELVFPVSAG